MQGKTLFLCSILLLIGVAAVCPADAQTWSQLSVTGTLPNTTGVFTTAYDSTNNRLMTFTTPGGSTASGVFVLTNPNGIGGASTWTQLAPTGSPGVNNGGATVVYDAAANQLIVYGGCGGNCSPALASVFVLTNANGLGGTPAWSESTPNRSIARTSQSAVYDPTTNSMITFGGDTAFFGSDQNDTNVLSPANGSTPTWTTLTTSGGPPPVRDSHSAVYDIKKNRMIIFGGQNIVSLGDIGEYNDVWVLSNANGRGGTPTWTELAPTGGPPAARSHHFAVYDDQNNTMYVFGGMAFSTETQTYTAFGDVWKLTNANGLGSETPEWTQIGQFGTPPGATTLPGAAIDSVNHILISFGGEDRNFVPFFQTFDLDLKVR